MIDDLHLTVTIHSFFEVKMEHITIIWVGTATDDKKSWQNVVCVVDDQIDFWMMTHPVITQTSSDSRPYSNANFSSIWSCLDRRDLGIPAFPASDICSDGRLHSANSGVIKAQSSTNVIGRNTDLMFKTFVKLSRHRMRFPENKTWLRMKGQVEVGEQSPKDGWHWNVVRN